MQSPTCTRLRIRSVHDAEVVLHAVFLGRLPMIVRRLDDEDRMALTSGCIYVWEERSSNPLEATGQEIQRFTEGRSWGPSRARDDFLIYYEKESQGRPSLLLRNNLIGCSPLVKQTYSVFVHIPGQNPRKWHLNAYYTQDTLEQLRTIDDIPQLSTIEVPPNRYICARMGGARRANRGLTQTQLTTAKDHSRIASSRAANCSPDSERSSSQTPSPDSPSFTVPSPRIRYPVQYVGRTGDIVHFEGRRLAPLEFLENISPKARDPVDDQALKSFSGRM
ncbi:uncharacterized protein LAESUDRAFT_693329 [Laetiporus sulphureus 93-53]|uniref:cAMP-independent regulatory protein pac2 n=1 Tax=Laetiporus sulphureus 93-53 TaxID=1314785 RepID=A0A165GW10_9APHY|nr:uncharacterized protein LAESUDRAFT_693329 [Laetiporus sulphureus 93-53]KZT10902.1 hypothetical protein LAESUDRAFT_693329 [Laetiporus sulphureus 93-53]